ncbi:MAG TPA: hypothetical protein VIL65_01495 [Beijerinckiaceae bacterium]|jgi:hypothetical protein
MITALILSERGVEALAVTLAALVSGVAEGVVGDAVVLARSEDAATARVADAMGAAFVVTGDASPWRAALPLARRDWLFCLEAGDVPAHGWIPVVERFLLHPGERRYARLRRPRGWPALAGAVRDLVAPRLLASGDLVHKGLLAGPRLPRPARLNAGLERDR